MAKKPDPIESAEGLDVLTGEVVDETPERYDRMPDWPPWSTTALEAMRLRPSLSRAAEQAGVHRRTLQRLVQHNEEFAVAFADARNAGLDRLEEVCLLRGTNGQPVKRTVTKTYKDKEGRDVTETTVYEEAHLSDILLMFYLKRWRPEYRDTTRLEHTGASGGPVKVEVYRQPDRQRALELAKIALELESGE